MKKNTNAWLLINYYQAVMCLKNNERQVTKILN